MIAGVLTSHKDGKPWVMRVRSQGEMDSLVRDAGFDKCTQRIDEWGILRFRWRCVVITERRTYCYKALAGYCCWPRFSSSPMDLLISSPRFRTLTAMISPVRYSVGKRRSLFFHGLLFLTGVWIFYMDFRCSFVARHSNSADLSTGLFWQR